jgi:hypothetical protein
MQSAGVGAQCVSCDLPPNLGSTQADVIDRVHIWGLARQAVLIDIRAVDDMKVGTASVVSPDP